MNPSKRSRFLATAFTAALLLTVGAVGLNYREARKDADARPSKAEALFDETRANAIGKGTKARVLIERNGVLVPVE